MKNGLALDGKKGYNPLKEKNLFNMMTILDQIYAPILLLLLGGLFLYIVYSFIVVGLSVLLFIWKMAVDMITLKSLRQTLRAFKDASSKSTHLHRW